MKELCKRIINHKTSQSDKIRIYTSIANPFCELGMTSNGWGGYGYFGLCCCRLFCSTLVLNYKAW